MSLVDDFEICNLALAKIGANPITSALLTTPGDNAAALACSKLFEPERDALMASFPWRFAVRRAYFDIDNFQDTITGTTAASPVVVTGTDISDANIAEDLGVYIWDTGIDDLDGETFIIKNISGETFELYHLDRVTPVDGTAFGTATTGYCRLSPITDYSYMFKLPSGILRIWKLDEDEEYTREFNVSSSYILLNSSEFGMEYIYLETSVTTYSEGFIRALSTKLAAELAVAISGKDDRKRDILAEYYNMVLPEAKRMEAIEINPSNRRSQKLSSWQKAGR